MDPSPLAAGLEPGVFFTVNSTEPEHIVANGLVQSAMQAMMATQSGRVSAIALAACFTLLFFATVVSPSLASEEPRLLKPRVPLVGHIYGIMVGQTGYLLQLFRRTRAPASTFPILHGKMYTLFTTDLIHAGLKNKNLSTEPFNEEVAGKLCNLDKASRTRILNPKGDESVFQVLRIAQLTTMRGDGLHQLGSAILRELATQVNGFAIGPDGLEVENLLLWIRSWLSPVHSKALYGKHDPFQGCQDLYDDFWIFEDATAAIIMSPLPRLTQSRAWQARERVQAASVAYYTAGHDTHPTVAPFMRARAAALRRAGLTPADVGRIEFFQFGAATGNSSATLLWFALHVLGDAAVLARLRAELAPLVRCGVGADGRATRTLDLAEVEQRCVFLLACWKETLRVVNMHTSVRRVLADTHVVGAGGEKYLLRKGCDVMMPHAVAHRFDGAWGAEALVFRPENFLPSGVPGVDRARRAAWIPFGGGANLCPGRRIAMVEHLAFVSTLVCGFDVESLDGKGLRKPDVMPMGLGHAILRPVEGAEELGVRLRRREGWEDVVWCYELGKTTKHEV